MTRPGLVVGLILTLVFSVSAQAQLMLFKKGKETLPRTVDHIAFFITLALYLPHSDARIRPLNDGVNDSGTQPGLPAKMLF